MAQQTITEIKPPLIVTETDHRKLIAIADAASRRFPEVADELRAEMERARVVAADAIPPDVVRMGSLVEFLSDSAQNGRVILVFPNEADIAQNKVSVLTPIGAALIGLSAGQSITWQAPDGHKHKLTVVKVRQPATDPASPEAPPAVVDLASRRKAAGDRTEERPDPDDDDPGPRAA